MYFCTYRNNMLKYFHPVREDSLIYSIDNIRANFTLSKGKCDDFITWINNAVYVSMYPENFAQFKYRHLYKVTYSAEGVMAVGIGFNGISENTRSDLFKGYLDFNPNKVGECSMFWEDFRFIKSCCKTFEVARIDLAIDIPVKRPLLIMEKDKRHYVLSAYSNENRTEYLGGRSTVGFVKLYNKTVEAKLDYDLSRLELTIEPSIKSFIKHIPAVYNIDGSNQMDISITQLNDTDRYILLTEWKMLSNGLDEGLLHFKSLGRKKYEKLKTYLLPDECKLSISQKAVTELLADFQKVYIC